jgi:glycosyltransferase involved in cell wall biosynthesis
LCASVFSEEMEMPRTENAPDRKLRILHVLRAPVGGLFRHVVDLTREQIARGHAVGLVTDSLTGGDLAGQILAELAPSLALGVCRFPAPRQPHILDVPAAIRIALHARALRADVVHGHGSKGGVYARLPAFLPGFRAPIRAYTPHGGSFHFRSGSYMTAERLLAARTDIFLFESAYVAGQFDERIGRTKGLARIVHNGLRPAEFMPVKAAPDAADFLFIGELCAAKGIDTLIDAMALLSSRVRRPRLMLVGAGREEAKLVARATRCGVSRDITFAGAMPASEAFRFGRILVVPSRAESLPYIVLEAAAAQVPIIATDVGGINEIFGPYRDRLIPCDNPVILAAAMQAALERNPRQLHQEAAALAAFVSTVFTIDDMADAVIAGYGDAIAKRPCRGNALSASFALPS